TAWHWLTTIADGAGCDRVFSAVRHAPLPTEAEARDAMARRLSGVACQTSAQHILTVAASKGWALAYALAWISVAGGTSVMPPWVRYQFPEAGRLVRRLRDQACVDPDCSWCRERHDARKELTRWFRFDQYRPEPQEPSGQPTQQAVVEAALVGEHTLAILPTGSGKSLCYQVPALSRYDKTGALTVVISPLVALMADQVASLERRGIGSCVTVNGMLSMPERADHLERVRMGDASILLISPEQLRSRALRRALDQREIGAWVLDEAHCLSRWGHDFRPDYRYVGRFIRGKAGDGPVPHVLCLTATAKPDVAEEIVAYFQKELGIGLRVFDRGARRPNLEFVVVKTGPSEKAAHVHQVLEADLPEHEPGGAIVYCATRRHTEELADFLRAKGVAVDHFHAGLSPETRKDVQARFIAGELRAIVATNAFGMGIDKPDVRLVVHADIPGSLENYLQEAGRAGRDQNAARCVLLYTAEDVERQFGLSARSRLTRREIQGVLKALRNLDRRKRTEGEVVATTGEILGEDEDREFERDTATDDTRLRTAVSWLEEAVLLSREENVVQVFPSSLRVRTVQEARERLDRRTMAEDYRRRLLRIVEALFEADADEGVTTDELMAVAGLSSEGVRKALYDLEESGIASDDTALTAYVHAGVERSSRWRFEQAAALEKGLVDLLREAAPDIQRGDSHPLHLRMAAQCLKDEGHGYALPERVRRLVRSIAADGRGEGGGGGSIEVRQREQETLRVTLRREWGTLVRTAELRRAAAKRLLDHLLAALPTGARGVDLLASTTLGNLLRAIRSDPALAGQVRDPDKLRDRALLWLHEQDVIRLNKGLTVFRQAMTIRLRQERRSFSEPDFQPLRFHYGEQVLQIHVMDEYAQLGLESMADAVRMAMDYFSLGREDFLQRWLPNRGRELAQQTTLASWRSIVDDLGNPDQRRIVADDREETNVLVLAGPGSGKTRVLVHRIAYLLRVRRENPRSILALAYNRHAAVEIRRRLDALVGQDARGVIVLTCHALAMRLAGASFSGRANGLDQGDFADVLRQAASLLRGEGLPPEEADDFRDRLLSGFRWILVDEYQDIGRDQYELIAALAGRTLPDEDDRLTIFAVGDDDQNIYAFNGSSVEYIRRFEADYGPRPTYLTGNYRSTKHIITAANALIEPARHRMKAGNSIHVDRARESEPPGGEWGLRDPVARGQVQILPAGDGPITQAQAAVAELQRMSTLDGDWDWSACAVVAREWSYLDPVRSLCELEGIPVQVANEDFTGFWHLRETRALVRWVRQRASKLLTRADLDAWLDGHRPTPWTEVLGEAVHAYERETGGGETAADHFVEWLAEWGRDFRRRQRGLLLLTAHRAKGLEFDHVVVLDGGWERFQHGEDADAPRRLYYVAMTRARKTLALTRLSGRNRLQGPLVDCPAVLRREAESALPEASPELSRRYRRLTLRDVFLSFAGYHVPGHSVHAAIADLAPGDALGVRVRPSRWELLDRNGTVVGHLARGFEGVAGMRCTKATVLAVATWDRERSEPDYQGHLRCDAWEVVVPELVFEQEAGSQLVV
ncbi:MAG: RecQ family ATP-dependent DNA helicase, partial [Chloroflexota bacterium]|nr:RecQ family ATP-dependent DNA helicase [Chloroflexota bacterium]